MVSFTLLPRTFLVFLLASPVLSTPTTPNDPFRSISIHVQKPPKQPICCLKPLPSLEGSKDENVLLSFEEWKIKQLVLQAKVKAKEREASSRNGTPNSTGAQNAVGESSAETLSSEAPIAVSNLDLSVPKGIQEHSTLDEQVSPHFRVPLTDRFNYASLDCSARVHTSHRSARSASAILSSKRDRYMLSPCSQEKQHVIVELCDDIRIDTVQLANFEFFSGVFKDFTVSVAKTYTDPEGWTIAGSYRAKNVRGVQSFHPPTTLRDFYRYIRIDFHSHYSNEYYCPISLLRVYGLTHLEQWKWDMWEAESLRKREGEFGEQTTLAEVTEESPIPTPVPVTESMEEYTSAMAPSGANMPMEEPPVSPGKMRPSTTLSIEAPQSTVSGVTKDLTGPLDPLVDTDLKPETSSASGGAATISAIMETPSSLPVSTFATQGSVTSSLSIIESPQLSKLPIHESGSAGSTLIDAIRLSASPSRVTSTISSTLSSASAALPLLPIPPPLPPSTGGESIYRTIMNRLTALEANHTLYARYMEEQTTGVREMLRRLTEDVGRLEGIGKAQAQMYQRTVNEWQKQHRRLRTEHGELMSRVNRLTDEVVLEKRLGIAQLCLLLAVLVFMSLTRGSRGEAIIQHGPLPRLNSSMREWGRRNLSFSGDWVNRFRSRSPTPLTGRTVPVKESGLKLEFPIQSSRTPTFFRTEKQHTPFVRPKTPTTVRTPSSRHMNSFNRQVLSTSRPQLRRSNSGGASSLHPFTGLGPVPKSAKRWARSSHLHEVKSAGLGVERRRLHLERDGVSDHTEREDDDYFSPPRFNGRSHGQVHDENMTPVKGKQTYLPRKPPTPIIIPRLPEVEDSAWVDTDVDGSELETSLEAISTADLG